MHWLVLYGLGLGTGAVVKVWGSSIAHVTRPAVRGVIKGGIVLSRELQRTTEEARASLEDIAAEAREELESPEQPAAPTNKRAR